jgi:RNA polymerase sporulation-specific sigma factor
MLAVTTLLISIKASIKKINKKFIKDYESTIYYIGGSEVLPKPLKSDEEAQLIKKLGTEEDAMAKSLLIERNLRLVVYIARKFENTGINVEDLISIGTIGLIKAINTFCAEKNIKLATYASRCIENEILMFLRRNTRIKSEVSIDFYYQTY